MVFARTVPGAQMVAYRVQRCEHCYPWYQHDAETLVHLEGPEADARAALQRAASNVEAPLPDDDDVAFDAC